jgi:SAM-dependent methyltransferase
MSAYHFCAELVASHAPKRALDYGCGAGEIVGLLRSKGIDASGCDVYYHGGDVSGRIAPDLAPHIYRMDDGRIPFPDATFDAVCSNFVLEHVPDLAAVSREIARVLKPGGVIIHLFPDRAVWREGHCDLPFIHWLPRNRFRIYYAAALYRLGMGAPRNHTSAMAWARHKCKWLDSWTHYRTCQEAHRDIGGQIEHLEHLWFDQRLGKRSLPAPVKRWVVRKMAGMVLACRP